MNKLDKFKLRISLLRIWVVKNLPVFLQLSILIAVIFALTGNLSPDTPILGSLSSSVNDALVQTDTGNFWLDLVTGIGTLLFSAGLLSSRLKSIALKDIKSKSLKKSLVLAGMYFDANGKLSKRLEKVTGIDLNGDGKIAGIDITEFPQENLIAGVFRTGEELITILTHKFETEQQIQEVKEELDFVETEQELNKGTNELVEDLKDSLLKAVETEFEDPVKRDALLDKTSDILGKTGSGIITAAKFVGSNMS
jgi:hypothetical protein